MGVGLTIFFACAGEISGLGVVGGGEVFFERGREDCEGGLLGSACGFSFIAEEDEGEDMM